MDAGYRPTPFKEDYNLMPDAYGIYISHYHLVDIPLGIGYASGRI
jgi:hypothetical protein